MTMPIPIALLWAVEASARIEWKQTQATFYGKPYDDGKKRVCADGKTVYTTNGMFCATRLVPLGSIIEVRYLKLGAWRKNPDGVGRTRTGEYITLRLKVTDTQAKRFGHLIDIPTGTWAKFGAKYSTGKIKVEWRLVK